jgi:hypothetical protein
MGSVCGGWRDSTVPSLQAKGNEGTEWQRSREALQSLTMRVGSRLATIVGIELPGPKERVNLGDRGSLFR